MKKQYLLRLAVGICTLLISTTVFSQNKDFYENYIAAQSKGIAHHFAQRYKLDQSRQEQVEKSFIEYYRAIDLLRNSSGSKSQKNASFSEIEKKRDNALKRILPSNQWKKYESDIARRTSDSLAMQYKRETLQKQ